MILSHIGVLLVCGTWLYITDNKHIAFVMYCCAFALWFISVVTVRGGIP